jgi:hypothetical protein
MASPAAFGERQQTVEEVRSFSFIIAKTRRNSAKARQSLSKCEAG